MVGKSHNMQGLFWAGGVKVYGAVSTPDATGRAPDEGG